MSTDRRYIVSYEMQSYAHNFPYTEIERIKKDSNIAKADEICPMVFHIECHKWSEDALLKTLKADQILYSDDGENFFKELI